MNVVVLIPAVASLLTPAVADGTLCFEGTCLFGWVWSILALTFVSAWVVRRWHDGDDLARRLLPVGSTVKAIVPQRVDLVPQTRRSPARSSATELVRAGQSMRAPPTTTDMAADVVEQFIDPASRESSPPPVRPSCPPGTPADDCPPGQKPPV